ncbi:hypothetical protein QQF64_023615 [Cirrhinus molitorella]|uniref:DUF5641 domain-containing protein n=1 Tax=Cirrhinus molitorella TaxID=172907 RepID=A0ABR3NJK4_9TELE
MWEREIRSVKSALHTIMGPQILTEEVLRTLLVEVESILNAKPLGYVSSDVADPDPLRQKWMSESDNLTPGTVVMIIDHQLPRGLWPVGKVITTYPGADGRVRSAKIEVKDKLYHRPVARLIRLPAIPDDNPTQTKQAS